MNTTMARRPQRRKCNDPNIFCYICGNFTLKDQRRNINTFVKKAYLAYFKVRLRDQDKSWTPHIVCKTCVETLRSWAQGKNAKLKFGVPMVWSQPTNHFDNCYFCLVDVKGFSKKTKHLLKYPDISSAIRPVAHCDEIPVPVFTELAEIDDELIGKRTSTDPIHVFQQSDADCDKPSLFSQHELNNLVRDLCLPEISAELLASRLQERRMLEPGVSSHDQQTSYITRRLCERPL